MSIEPGQVPQSKPEPESVTDGLDLGPMQPALERTNFCESHFFAEYLNRLVSGRDMHIIVTAGSETGVGKTTLAVSLALLMDQRGWTAEKAAVAMPDKYSALYDQVGPGSVLLLDEAEKAADARRGMKKESVNLTQDFATKRYQQVFGILTAPTKSWVDKRLGADAADYWIQALDTDMGRIKGEAIVYRLRTNEISGNDYVKRAEVVEWPKLDWHPEFQKLDQRKQDLLEDDEGSQYIHTDEVDGMIKKAKKETKRKQRRDMILSLIDKGVTQTTIAQALELSTGRISQIKNNI